MFGGTRPNLFLVGAMKAGTTTLASILANSKQVYVPLVKEPCHFGLDIHQAEGPSALQRHRRTLTKLLNGDLAVPRHYLIAQDRSDYLKLYEGWNGERWLLDASTTYLYSRLAAEEINQFNPLAKIIVITRNPVERAWSEFRMNQRIGASSNDYLAALDREEQALRKGQILAKERYVTAGLYDDQIARYLKYFDESQLLVLSFEDMKENLGKTIVQLAQWLSIDLDVEVDQAKNAEAEARFPRINRLLHRTGLKRAIQHYIPQNLRTTLVERFYVNKKTPIPEDFKAQFFLNYRIYSTALME